MSYYTALMILCWMSLGVLCVLVHENSWIPKKDKTLFYLTYGIIALSAFTEWLGIQLSGNQDIPSWLLTMVKCFDYMLTPMAGGAIVAQMKLRNRWYKLLMAILVGNAVFQIISCFTHWMVVIDDTNHYTHGPLYIVYIIIYLAIVLVTAMEFLIFSMSHRKRNRTSLISAFLLVLIGISIQEVLGSEYRTAYIALTMCVGLMFIHYAEFYKMDADERIRLQREQLMIDALSGVFSRHAYMKAMDNCKDMDEVQGDITAFSIDINGLKIVNDTAGHDAGDELIVGAAECIEKAVGDLGKCYRIGGDEFVVLGRMSREQADEVLRSLEREAEAWTKDKDRLLSLSADYARAEAYPGLTVEELVKKADQAMYAVKTEYYQKNGLNRRGL